MDAGQSGSDTTDWKKPIPDRTFAISDETFCRYLARLRQLQEFLYQEAVPIHTDDAAMLELGDLSGLHFHPEGRMPTAEEWNKVGRRTQTIFLILTPVLRRKFLMGGTPWMITWLPLYFLGLAVFSLVFALVVMGAVGWPDYLLFVVYVVWLASLGAIGASASIGMNALSIQDDITFDLTNMRLMSLRIALGALFGVVLSLPFGYPEFVLFCKAAWKPGVFFDPNAGVLTKQAIFLLLPFILGFSTSLVIQVLTQLVEAVQTFLGRKPHVACAHPSIPPRSLQSHAVVTDPDPSSTTVLTPNHSARKRSPK
jgi:hypothetical protein